MISSRRILLQARNVASLRTAARSQSFQLLQQGNANHHQPACVTTVWGRHFATEDKKEGDSLRDTVNRLKQKDKKNTEATTEGDQNDFFVKAANMFDSFSSEVGKAWEDLVKAGERKDINKKLKRPEATAEGEKEYTGPVAIMVIDESEHLTAWERMQRRLTEAPIIQDIMNRSEQIYEQSGAKEAKAKIDDLREDAREAWETSQNPWVYRASSVYDTLTAETAESVAVKELRVLDPDFTLDDWRRDVVEYTLPQIMEWFLQGKVNQLKPWLGEGVFKRIASEVAARKQEGVQIDTHVLGIMNSEILAVEVSLGFDVSYSTLLRKCFSPVTILYRTAG